jgi:flagellar basal-body rod modification protein FlgD
MQVSASTSAVDSRPQTDAQKATLDYNAFLRLLLQQLKSQDPTDPVDQKESLAQLAQFSSVEQSIKLNEKVDELLQQSNINQAANLIGKTVVSLTSGEGGVVRAVEVTRDDMHAILEDGRRLNVSEGLRIS